MCWWKLRIYKYCIYSIIEEMYRSPKPLSWVFKADFFVSLSTVWYLWPLSQNIVLCHKLGDVTPKPIDTTNDSKTSKSTGCPQKNETGFLLNSSGHREANYSWPIYNKKSYPYVKNFSERSKEAEILNSNIIIPK